VVKYFENQGKELPTAPALLHEASRILGDRFPELLLNDSLYFTQKYFREVVTVRHRHLLIKSSDPCFRDVLQDAQALF